VQGLFVSVDPERDSLDRLQAYGAYFHPNILGITGSEDEVATAAGLYGVAYRKADQASATGYTVDHSADSYIIDREGGLERTMGIRIVLTGPK
jgi:protein SCO1/2